MSRNGCWKENNARIKLALLRMAAVFAAAGGLAACCTGTALQADAECVCVLGYTAGSMCYLCEDMLFTGDTLFTEGCGYCKGAGADSHQMYHSIQKLKQCIPPDTIILPGHKFKFEIGKTFAELENVTIYLQIENENQFSKFRDRSGQKGLFDIK